MLEAKTVRLEPLAASHQDGLLEAAQSHDIWEWLSLNLSQPDTLTTWMASALRDQETGSAYPFVVIDRHTGRTLGSTRYMNIHSEDRGVEIGWTWYIPTVWGTAINPETKLLLLKHAFDDWKALRVVLRTDHLNIHSQAAIRKLGAVYEGTLRNHRIRPDGTIRHSVVFSITPDEWPTVEHGLVQRLKNP